MGAGWVVLIVAAALAALLLILWALWQALLLRYQEEPDAHEIHSVKTKDGWQIKLFRYKPENSNGEPVLLCHGAFANHTNFTKPRGACLVDTLLAYGYDCWLIDFRGTRSSEPPLGRKRTRVEMDDYLLYDIPAALAFIRQVTGLGHVHWIGHSLGGMLLYAHVLLHGNHTIASGTTLGSPVGFEGARVARHRLLLKFTRAFPHLAGAMMRTGGRVARVVRPRTRVFPINWSNLHGEVRGRDLFNMIETPPPKMAQELADWATKKTWRMNGGELDVVAGFNRLDIPLFAIYGAADPFVPVDQALQFVEALPNPKKQVMILCTEDGFAADYNHVDLAFGKEGVEDVYEPIVEWLHENRMRGRESREDIEREGRAFLARRITVSRAQDASGALRSDTEASLLDEMNAPEPLMFDDAALPDSHFEAVEKPPAARLVDAAPLTPATTGANEDAEAAAQPPSTKNATAPAKPRTTRKSSTGKKRAATTAKTRSTAKKNSSKSANTRAAAKKGSTASAKPKPAAKKRTTRTPASTKKAATKKRSS